MKIVVDSRQRHPRRVGARHPARARLPASTSCTPRSTATSRTTIPDPSKPENLAELIARGRSATDAELGLAFDGDGDRLGVVTKDGHIIYPDRQLMLFARDVLKRNAGATIIYDVKCTQRLAPLIRAAGGEPLMWKTGHSLIKAKMKEIGAPLAGEMSGHIFFGERWYGFDDATYTAARLLEILSRAPTPSAVLERAARQLQHARAERRLRRGRAAAGRRRAARRRRSFRARDEVVTIDGVRAEYDDGFGLIRASNTTPVLVLRFEGTRPRRWRASRPTAWRRCAPSSPTRRSSRRRIDARRHAEPAAQRPATVERRDRCASARSGRRCAS